MCRNVNPHLCPGNLWGWNSDGLTRQRYRCALDRAEHLRAVLYGGENWEQESKDPVYGKYVPLYGKLIKEQENLQFCMSVLWGKTGLILRAAAFLTSNDL